MPLSSHITDFCASGNIRKIDDDPRCVRVYPCRMERNPPHYLKEWRKFRRLTQEALANAMDTTKSVISDMERDNLQLSPKWARRIAPILGTTPGHLLDTDPNDVDSDLLEIWTQIPAEDRAQAAKVLRSFVRTGTDG